MIQCNFSQRCGCKLSSQGHVKALCLRKRGTSLGRFDMLDHRDLSHRDWPALTLALDIVLPHRFRWLSWRIRCARRWRLQLALMFDRCLPQCSLLFSIRFSPKESFLFIVFEICRTIVVSAEKSHGQCSACRVEGTDKKKQQNWESETVYLYKTLLYESWKWFLFRHGYVSCPIYACLTYPTSWKQREKGYELYFPLLGSPAGSLAVTSPWWYWLRCCRIQFTAKVNRKWSFHIQYWQWWL